MILIDKVVQKLKLKKITKNVCLNHHFSFEHFDIDNDFESQNLSLFGKAAKLCKVVEDTCNQGGWLILKDF